MYQCANCGSLADPVHGCPGCGRPAPPLAAEIERLDRDIAEMTARDLAIQRERANLSAKMQAALHQRALLQSAQAQRLRRPPRQRRGPARVATLLPNGRSSRLADTPSVVRPTRGRAGRAVDAGPTQASPGVGQAAPGVGRAAAAAGAARATGNGGAGEAVEWLQPEASSRSVQNALLGLGAMLLALAAAIFAAYFITSFAPLGRVAILVVATSAVLMIPPLVSARGLTSTAEWITGVGLVLVPLVGYALWGLAGVRAAVPSSVFAGLVSLGTAALAWAYHLGTRLTTPRYAALLTVQPVVPLLAQNRVHTATGWALVFATIAAADMAIAGWLTRQPADPRLASTGWLREVAWILHGLAVGAALAYATVGLATADTVPLALAGAGMLLAAAAIGLAGALSLRYQPLPDIAAAVLTLAVIGSAARVAAVALPGRALVLIAGAVAVTSTSVRILPPAARRGPQLAASGAIALVGAVVAALALRAGAAPVRAVLPPWHADLSRYAQLLDDSVGPAGWQLAAAAALLTVAAVLAVPAAYQWEAATVGAANTALAVPAALGLPWLVTPWVLVTGAVLIAIAGLFASTLRAARTQAGTALAVGLVGAAASLADRELTAGVLATLTVSGVLLGSAPRYVAVGQHAAVIAQWAQGGAVAAFPGAVATVVAAALDTPRAVPVLAASLLAVAATLSWAAMTQVAQRPHPPAAFGATACAVAVVIAAFAADGTTPLDAVVAALLLVGALLLWLAPSIDASRRADRKLDGADVAAAVVAAGALGALARVAALIVPGAALVTTAAVVFVVAVGLGWLPASWRLGPVLGAGVASALVLAAAGYSAALGALRVLIAASPVWHTDLAGWPAVVAVARGYGWHTPVALLLLAAAGAVALPLRSRAVAVPLCVALAVAGAPAALALPWWSPMVLGLGFGTLLSMAAITTHHAQLGFGLAGAGGALVGHAVGASLVAPSAMASTLAGITAAGLLVACLARLASPAGRAGAAAGRVPAGVFGLGAASHKGPTRAAAPIHAPAGEMVSHKSDDQSTVEAGRLASNAAASPAEAGRVGWNAAASTVEKSHLGAVGGASVVAALLALPGAVAAAAAHTGQPAHTVLPAALAATSIGLVLVALLPNFGYLGYAAAGSTVSATVVALAAATAGEPYAVYAAAATLLGVLAELLRAGGQAPSAAWPRPISRRVPWTRRSAVQEVGAVLTPGLLAMTAVPTLVALVGMGPALYGVLVGPAATLRQVWQGPSAAGVDWAGAADLGSVLAALVLTLAAALLAVGFGGRAQARLSRDELLGQVVPVLLPGIAITLLIAPAGLGLGWPAGTTAALAVFTIAMLGLALTSPPLAVEAARPLRVTRWMVFGIGLVAGSAGLSGALATRSLTLNTLAGAVCVGLTAALRGRTSIARTLGWAFASAAAHMFAYVIGLALGLPRPWSAFGVLAVAAATTVVTAALPALKEPTARLEAVVLQWSGYAGAVLSLALAATSLPHLAALLAAVGAVLGVVALQPSHGRTRRRVLLWSAVGCELIAWWLLMRIATIALPEAYTLAFAVLALAVGIIELRHHPEVGSWAAYGPALVATFMPTLAIVLVTDAHPARRILLLLGAVATLIAGSLRRQRAPVVIGGIVTTIAALHELFEVSVWLIFIPVGILLIVLGGQYEKRRRDLQRLRGALNRMR